jgi:hypothetical protein
VTDPEMESLEAELDRLRRRVAAANLRLLYAVDKACPGPHKTVQHRDRKPPWCAVCGRTDLGVKVRDPKVYPDDADESDYLNPEGCDES